MRQILPFLAASASLVALMSSAHAQEQAQGADVRQASERSVGELDTIIVQARRRDEDVQDVPAVINAVTADAIAQLNMRNFADVSSLAPGLNLSAAADGITGSAQLRGVNFESRASGNNATVEFYLNDAPIAPGIVIQQMYDIGQIEVQRGPQGTLRGRASPSGSITVSTRKPDLNEFGGFVDGTINDIETRNIKGGLNIPLIPGYAAIRVAGLYDENELDRVRPINETHDGRGPKSKTKSGRISALVEPTDWIVLEGMYQRLDRDALTYDQAISFSEVNPNAAASPVRLRAKDRLSIQEEARIIEQEYDIYNWRAEFAGLGQRLIYQGQHYKQKTYSTENWDLGNLFPNRDLLQHTDTIAKGTSHEFRIQNEERIFDIFDYVVGYFQNKLDSPSVLNRPTAIRLPLEFGGGLASVVETNIGRENFTKEKSYFGHLTAHIGDATEVSGGLRQVEYKSVSSTVIGGNKLPDDLQDDSKLIYSAAIRHNFSPNLAIYAATGSSYRPGINVIGDFNITPSPLELSFINLPPETSKSYEIGLKSDLFDGRMRFNVTAFHQKFKNYPYRVPNNGVYYLNTVALRDGAGNVTGLAQQVASFNFVAPVPVEVNGIESEVTYEINDRWNVGLVASYALGKIKNGSIPCNDLNSDGVPDATTSAPSPDDLRNAVGSDNLSACQVTQRSSFGAPFTATLTSEYNVPVSDNINGYLRGLISYSGKSQGDPGNSYDDVGAYGLVNLYTGLRDVEGGWEVSLFVKNLFNTTKVLTRTEPLFTAYQQLGAGGMGPNGPIFTGPVAQTFTSTYTGGTLTPPREFGISLRYAFGSR